MNKKTLKKSILPMVAVIAVVVIYIVVIHPYVGRQQAGNNIIEDSGLGSPTNSGIPGVDFDNDRQLVGFFQNIFAGKVVKYVGNEGNAPTAHAQYDVDVIYNIKGNASGRIVLDFNVTLGGESLIPGTTYLFATLHSVEKIGPWYYLGYHPGARVLVTENSGLTNENLRGLILKNKRTYELLNAYPNEILYAGHVKVGITNNGFQFLSDEEKQAVFAKFDELIPPRPIPEIFPQPTSPAPSSDSSENIGSLCHDGIDNDKDGLIDQKDPECAGFFREDLPALCRDNDDNDRDGLIDSADPDCAQFYPPQPAPPPPPPYVPPPTPTSTAPAAPTHTTSTQ